MKQLRTISLIALVGLALTALTAGTAFAAGTNSGVTISNQATIDYEVGGVNQPDILSDSDSNSANGAQATTFLVDNRVDLTMAGNNNASTSGNNQILIFTLTNTGNTTQAYDLDLFTGASPADDNFNMNNVRVYIDVNKDGALDGGDTLYTVAGTVSIGDVPANSAAASTVQILIVADTPAGTPSGQTAAYSLVATTLNQGTTTVTTATAGADTAGVDVVLADGAAAAGVGGATDAVTNGKYLATGTYTVQSAQLTVAKAVTVISDPVNGASNPKAIPGAIVEYTIDITNTGAAAATLLVLTDPIPANTDFYVGSVVAPGGATVSYDNGATTFTYVPGAGPTDPAVTHVRVSIASVAGSGGTAQVKFRVQIE